MIGVNVEPDSKAANDWLKQTPVTFPILYDTDSKVSKLYGVAGMPSTVIVDRKGTVRMIHRGYKPGRRAGILEQHPRPGARVSHAARSCHASRCEF